MIQQPDLGKKIANLRKAKGLTQEELVEKCNLNVRTLQRIESGEVTPRIYTIRLIFEALDFSFKESQNDKGLIKKWLEQFYINFIDLFNLKTNTMKKITILALLATAIVFGITSFTHNLLAQKESKTGNSQANTTISDDTLKEKLVVAGSFNGSDNDEEFNGRYVNCKINGVIFKSPLLIVDKKTHEFQTVSAKGILSNNKIEITETMLKAEYSADNNIQINGNKLILKGKARLFFSDYEIIEAEEIILNKE